MIAQNNDKNLNHANLLHKLFKDYDIAEILESLLRNSVVVDENEYTVKILEQPIVLVRYLLPYAIATTESSKIEELERLLKDTFSIEDIKGILADTIAQNLQYNCNFVALDCTLLMNRRIRQLKI